MVVRAECVQVEKADDANKSKGDESLERGLRGDHAGDEGTVVRSKRKKRLPARRDEGLVLN